MKVGILGSGDVGKALARGFIAEGYDVGIATRDPASQKAVELAQDVGVAVKDFRATAEFGELIVLCTAWSGTESALELAGNANLTGKIIIDATNPILDGPKLALGYNDSGGEQIQRWLPDSKVVKAFNSANNKLMYRPKLDSGPPTMFICGNDTAAKQKVSQILVQFGWEVADIGDITGARELEPLCILWVKYGRATGGWHHAYKMLH
jgi:predicted dinucleotide-binding enzyme